MMFMRSLCNKIGVPFHVRTFLFLVTILACTQTSYAQTKKELKALRKGVFTYEGMYGGSIITRTGSKQIETSADGKQKLILKIRWLDDKTYVLTFIKEINMPGCMRSGDTITTSIIEWDDKGYSCNYVSTSCGKGSCKFIKIE
jgi:hypothetical protein